MSRIDSYNESYFNYKLETKPSNPIMVTGYYNDLDKLKESDIMMRGIVIYDTEKPLGYYIATQQVVVFSDSQALKSKEFPVEGIAGLLIVESGWIDDVTHRYVRQRYITRDNSNEYTRMYNIDSWTPWISLY